MRIIPSSLRRVLILGALLLALPLVLAACGDDDDDDDAGNTGSGGEPAATVTAGDSTDTGGDAADFDETIMFGDYGWDSAIVHNRVAQYIIENGFGYETDSVAGETITLFQGLVNRDVDVSMEIWVDQQPQFEPEVEAGTILDLGPNYPNSIQGLVCPDLCHRG